MAKPSYLMPGHAHDCADCIRFSELAEQENAVYYEMFGHREISADESDAWMAECQRRFPTAAAEMAAICKRDQ